MRQRIATLAVLSAVLATSLFAIPLAIAAAHYFLSDEAAEVEHLADTVAIDVASDMVQGRPPGELPNTASQTSVALYSRDGRLISGYGPSTADAMVRQAFADNAVRHESGLGRLSAAVPIGDNAGYVVRATTSAAEIYPRIAFAWVAMLALEAVILVAVWQLASRQARRLARPVEDLAASAARLGDGDFTVRAPHSGIDELDSAATALNQAASRIGGLVDRERAVTANASHQLRTPLAGLRLRLETALYAANPDYASICRDALEDIDRLDRTIDDLITLARSGGNRTEHLDVAALLDDIASSYRGPLRAAGRTLLVTMEPDLPQCCVSTAAVRQILAVLVDNAALHGAGTVSIHARSSSTSVAISVSDEGPGPAADNAELFGRSPVAGHRIGLALARSLAEAEGGRLLITSRGSSTAFTLFLPEDGYESLHGRDDSK